MIAHETFDEIAWLSNLVMIYFWISVGLQALLDLTGSQFKCNFSWITSRWQILIGRAES